MKPKELIRESEMETRWKNYKPEEALKPTVTYFTIYEQALAAAKKTMICTNYRLKVSMSFAMLII